MKINLKSFLNDFLNKDFFWSEVKAIFSQDSIGMSDITFTWGLINTWAKGIGDHSLVLHEVPQNFELKIHTIWETIVVPFHSV